MTAQFIGDIVTILLKYIKQLTSVIELLCKYSGRYRDIQKKI